MCYTRISSVPSVFECVSILKWKHLIKNQSENRNSMKIHANASDFSRNFSKLAHILTVCACINGYVRVKGIAEYLVVIYNVTKKEMTDSSRTQYACTMYMVLASHCSANKKNKKSLFSFGAHVLIYFINAVTMYVCVSVYVLFLIQRTRVNFFFALSAHRLFVLLSFIFTSHFVS